MAKELDDYETELYTEAIIEVAEIVPIQPSPSNHSKRPSTPMSPQLLSIPPPNTASIHPKAPQSPLGSQFVFPPPVVESKEKDSDAEDVPDTVSVHSVRSVKSVKSPRRGEELSRTSSVLAAKTRSRKASQSSLRLTTGHSRKQSSIRLTSSQKEQPPIPELPLHFTVNDVPALTPYASSTLLLDSRNPSLRRQGSLDTVCTTRSPATSAATVAFRGRSADDTYLRPYNSSSSEIQLVSRYQVHDSTAETSTSKTNTMDCDSPSKAGLYLACCHLIAPLTY